MLHHLLRAAARVLALASLLALTGCATHYLDGAVKDVAPGEFKSRVQARPVQVIVEFQTNGVTNARATEHVKPMVMENLKSSGLFTDIQDKPVEGGALLSVQINNVALLDEALKKGFMTGLTLGLAGSLVTDAYVCTVTYSSPSSAGPIVKMSKHAIHTSMGASDAPPGGVKQSSVGDAVKTMVRQIVDHALREVSRDSAFQ
ncbi:hypothetical protein [Ramlibacter sp.]|uniref:hypothetical protein n=1 Tax=Ramlibacter sp. TaxID=1917967 RepID=UPI003D0A3728